MKIYNSLSRKIEKFEPLNANKVGMYTCGPTVYQFAHIGNFRTYVLSDLVFRTLKFLGYEVRLVMNLTDVGHLTGDNLGDADIGSDRMEESARREGRSAWEVAKFYTEAFLRDFKALELVSPEVWCKATDHIKEQVELVKTLEKKGYTYRTSDGIYFDTGRFPAYGELSTLGEIKEGARVEVNPEKRSPRDFALWKFSYPGGRSFDSVRDDASLRRQMEWESPWGIGFPGWHIECSAMAMKYLGESFDIHVGGEDLRSTHHPNEIAQSEAATGKKFVRFWIHGAFVLVDGKRMSKSAENNFRLTDLQERGYSPFDLRYLFLTARYRDRLNITFSSLDASRAARMRLAGMVVGWRKNAQARTTVSNEKLALVEALAEKFKSSIEMDLNFPKALTVVWEMAKSMIPDREKLDLISQWDEVLSLGLSGMGEELQDIPPAVLKLVSRREELRREGTWKESDLVRQEIGRLGYVVEDTVEGSVVKKRQVEKAS